MRCMRLKSCQSRCSIKVSVIFTFFVAAALTMLFPEDGISSAAVETQNFVSLRLTEFSDSHPENATSAGWRLEKYKGDPSIRVERFGDHVYLRMTSSGHTAFGVRKQISVDIRQYPFLHWTWKAQRLPAGGDVRRADRDDQVLQVYVIFPMGAFFNIMKSPTIAYVWDNEAPKNLMIQSPQKRMEFVRYIVLRNKADALRRWQQEKRNLYEDYKIMFKDVKNGEPSGPIQALVLFINTHHTGSDAEGTIGEMYFSTKGE